MASVRRCAGSNWSRLDLGWRKTGPLLPTPDRPGSLSPTLPATPPVPAGLTQATVPAVPIRRTALRFRDGPAPAIPWSFRMTPSLRRLALFAGACWPRAARPGAPTSGASASRPWSWPRPTVPRELNKEPAGLRRRAAGHPPDRRPPAGPEGAVQDRAARRPRPPGGQHRSRTSRSTARPRSTPTGRSTSGRPTAGRSGSSA